MLKMKRICLKLILACMFSLPCFASDRLKEMSLEEKVGQLLMVHFYGEEANEEAAAWIQTFHVGGIIYYNWANGLSSPPQVLELSKGLQSLAQKTRLKIPLLIAVDQEGGYVSRLNDGFTVFPGNQDLGMTKRPYLAEQAAFIMGQEMRAVGINLNLAPVVDIHAHPDNPMGMRSFGNSPGPVISFSKKALKGYHRAGVMTTLKHFPGLGGVSVDSHLDLPILEKSLSELQAIEFRPFAKLAAQTDFVMTAHILVPSIDPTNCATLSKKILSFLRSDIGFEGVILTDALTMKGLLKNTASLEEAAIRAIEAGCDMLLIGYPRLMGTKTTPSHVQNVHQAIMEAVQKGLIDEKRIDESVQRILTLKAKYPPAIPSETTQDLSTSKSRLLAQHITKLANRSRQRARVRGLAKGFLDFDEREKRNNQISRQH